jgi:glycosyltransferase involved in cell wall biosynthesis
MRIAFDHQIFRQTYGGISRYFTQLAQGLIDLNQDVRVIAPLYQNSYLASLPGGVVRGRYIQRYPPKMGWMILKCNDYLSRSQIARLKPDLLHETYYSSVCLAPVGCPTVITVHDMIHELFPNEFLANDKTVINKRIAIDRADHVICISDNTKSDLMRICGTSPNKISVVHHGFDQFGSHNAEVPHINFIGKPFLLYVGQREGYKNFTGLLKAMASSRKLMSDFDIIAFGGPTFSSAELNLMTSLGFTENQVQYKRGNDELLVSLYSQARAFVYPSLYEGFGIPPLEAMAHLCPVISSNCSSMPEIIGDAAEYFAPSNIDDMCRAIEAVVFSDTNIANLKKLGTERLTSFSWKKCAEQTYEIYQSIK